MNGDGNLNRFSLSTSGVMRITGEHVGIGVYSRYPADFNVFFVEEQWQ
jgi:hypothetical protein